MLSQRENHYHKNYKHRHVIWGYVCRDREGGTGKVNVYYYVKYQIYFYYKIHTKLFKRVRDF